MPRATATTTKNWIIQLEALWDLRPTRSCWFSFIQLSACRPVRAAISSATLLGVEDLVDLQLDRRDAAREVEERLGRAEGDEDPALVQVLVADVEDARDEEDLGAAGGRLEAHLVSDRDARGRRRARRRSRRSSPSTRNSPAVIRGPMSMIRRKLDGSMPRRATERFARPRRAKAAPATVGEAARTCGKAPEEVERLRPADDRAEALGRPLDARGDGEAGRAFGDGPDDVLRGADDDVGLGAERPLDERLLQPSDEGREEDDDARRPRRFPRGSGASGSFPPAGSGGRRAPRTARQRPAGRTRPDPLTVLRLSRAGGRPGLPRRAPSRPRRRRRRGHRESTGVRTAFRPRTARTQGSEAASRTASSGTTRTPLALPDLQLHGERHVGLQLVGGVGDAQLHVHRPAGEVDARGDRDHLGGEASGRGRRRPRRGPSGRPGGRGGSSRRAGRGSASRGRGPASGGSSRAKRRRPARRRGRGRPPGSGARTRSCERRASAAATAAAADRSSAPPAAADRAFSVAAATALRARSRACRASSSSRSLTKPSVLRAAMRASWRSSIASFRTACVRSSSADRRSVPRDFSSRARASARAAAASRSSRRTRSWPAVTRSPSSTRTASTLPVTVEPREAFDRARTRPLTTSVSRRSWRTTADGLDRAAAQGADSEGEEDEEEDDGGGAGRAGTWERNGHRAKCGTGRGADAPAGGASAMATIPSERAPAGDEARAG